MQQPGRGLSPFVRVTVRRWLKMYSAGSRLYWPLFDLFLRVSIAQTFIRSGMVKLGNWDTAVLLAREEYPVSWLAPDTAAAIGLSIEIVGPVLLVIGLFTRPAALAMGLLLLTAQIVHIPTTTNLFLIALLGWYALHGPAAISLDNFIKRALGNSGFLFAKRAFIASEFAIAKLAPLWIAAIRMWLAITFLAVAGVFEPSIAVATWLPITSLQIIAPALAILFAAMLITGFLASVTSGLALLAGIASAIVGVHPDIMLYPVLLLALYEAKGPGILAIDGWISRWSERNVLFDRNPSQIPDDWPHIVVVGAGFGGLAAVNKLKHLPVRITLLDKRNYHLFQPLLYQIAAATLSPADIAIAIRSLFREDGNVTVIKSEVKGIDPVAGIVEHGDGIKLPFDRAVIATGAQHSYFGRDEWSKFAPGLKTIEDGVSVRRAVLNAFEQAELTSDQDKIKRLLNFAIVGGGPTGVELAGAIAELSMETIKRDFRTFDPSKARVVLIQSASRVLPTFPEELSCKAEASLKELGVEVRTNSRASAIASDHIMVGDERIDTETVLWAAGVAASPAAKWIGCEADRAGRAKVDDHLRVPEHPGIFIIGDTASANAWDGNPAPGLAPAAKQAGAHVAKVIEAELLGKVLPASFEYKHQGSLATIGRRSAVADFGAFRMSGAPAWWLWGLVHVGFLAGTRNRASVVLNWLWSYFAHQSSARLITDSN